MKIGSVSGAMLQGANRNMQSDSVSRNLQSRIAKAQKELQELSANKDMAPEEKMKKRQEIQQEINSLNLQLRQHQAELRREKQQSADSSMEDSRL